MEKGSNSKWEVFKFSENVATVDGKCCHMQKRVFILRRMFYMLVE